MNINEDTQDTTDWTVAEVTSFPKCDYCDDAAGYDSRVAGHTAWAWMCETHFQRYGSGVGCGIGQRLVLSPKVTG